MKVKLIGDGTYANTDVVNAETGERLEGIVSLQYILDPVHRLGHLILDIKGASVEVEGWITEILDPSKE